MADYFAHFSCLLDVGTPRNGARAQHLYNGLCAEGAAEDPPSESFDLSIDPALGGSNLWMRDDGTADPRRVIDFVLRCADAFGCGAHVLDLGRRDTVAWVRHAWLAPRYDQRNPAMSIPYDSRANFQTLLRAAADGNPFDSYVPPSATLPNEPIP
jgi:hypothetical protein